MSEYKGIIVKATVTGKRQITIPKEICDLKRISTGDQIVFREENGSIVIEREPAPTVSLTLKDYVSKGYLSIGDIETIKESISNRSHFIIVGILGCGKSTFLRAIINEINSTEFSDYAGDNIFIIPEANTDKDMSTATSLIINNSGMVLTTTIDKELCLGFYDSFYGRNILIIEMLSKEKIKLSEITKR